MNPCPMCFSWNLPLALVAQLSADGAVVPLRFEQWLAFHLHIVIHQAGRWPGEIETLSKSLQTLESVLT